MAKRIILEPSRTLAEFRLLPGYTSDDCSVEKISLTTPLVCGTDKNAPLNLNIPLVAAAMQSVSGSDMGIALAKNGGVAFIYVSQTPESQAAMVRKVKQHKAGFVRPCTIRPDMTVQDLQKLRETAGFSTFPVVDDNNVLLGIITKNDYEPSIHASAKIHERMIPRSKLLVGVEISNLKKANEILTESHHGVLPIVDREDKLLYLVFRKDIHNHLNNPLEVVDSEKRLVVGAALNTRDYEQRIPLLAEAGVDILLVDSSDGHTVYQARLLNWVRKNYPKIPIIAGNIITADGFRFLADNGAHAIKVGMGGGSICITQEQKGTGRGLATAILETAQARDEYFEKTGKYIPVIADGGVVHAKDICMALALGADSVMMGRYFARMEESPTEKVVINNRVMKPYWGEGSPRAREWRSQRYQQDKFAEGVEGYVEYAGKLSDNLSETIAKIKSTFCSCGTPTVADFHKNAVLELVSALSIREGQVHDIYLPGPESVITN
ncbi:MAG: IMP dehydrogenase [Candidatus Riflebacteria bacterium]|nr:IMP dehydrogenase [Candidatus Riflebacteria bacterium]